MSNPETQPVGDPQPIIEAVNLVKHFAVSGGLRDRFHGRRVVHAVDDVSISLQPGEIVSVVGESGSGKTTVGRLMSRLETTTSGELRLHGNPVPTGGAASLRSFRRDVQVVFQDPYSTLR